VQNSSLLDLLLLRNSHKERIFSGSLNRGFTIIELLVATLVGTIVIGLALSSSLAVRDVYEKDLVRSRINENIRGAMSVLGATVREAGENLPGTFKAVEFVPGTGSASDELILRRNLKDEVLKVCQDITAGSSASSVYFALATGPQGCAYSDNAYNFNQWQTYRTAEGGSVQAYIYDHASGEGEFFEYTSETDTGTSFAIVRSGGSWANDYSTDSAAVYILEEWHFSLVDDAGSDTKILRVVENGEETEAMNVMYGIYDFQVQAVMTDDSKQDNFASDETWVDLKAVEVTTVGLDYDRDGSTAFRTLTSQFFPRNILSN